MSDFGMSKVIDTTNSRFTTPLTMVPGTLAYMPQEALGENPKYTEKLDCFSFGVLVIQILTRLFPNPLPRKREVESALSLTGTVLIPVAETECRKEHIDMISRQHPLLDIAIDCLALKMDNRPSARELCLRVEELQVPSPREVTSGESSNHSPPADVELCRVVECLETKQHLEEEIVRLQQLLEDDSEQCPTCAESRAENRAPKENMEESEIITNLRQELEEVLQNSVFLTEIEHCSAYIQLKARIEDLESQLENRHEVIHNLEDEVADLRRQSEEASANVPEPRPCQTCAELEETRRALEERVAILMNEASVHEENMEAVLAAMPSNQVPVPPHPAVHHPPASALSISNIRSGMRAPAFVAQSSSTVFRNSVYCRFDGGAIFGYDILYNTWRQSPPLAGANLIVTHEQMDKLMPVAGKTLHVMHDGRWTRLGDLRSPFWGLHYHDGHFIVFGPSVLRAIKLEHGIITETHSLNTSPSFSYASTVICNGFVYLLGVWVQQQPTNRIFRVAINSTLFRLRSKSSWFPKSRTVHPYWKEIAPLPVAKSTGFTFRGNLLAVGGCTISHVSADIFFYNEQKNEWLVIGRIYTPRYSCLAEVIGNELVVVGGWLDNYSKCDLVEIVTFL